MKKLITLLFSLLSFGCYASDSVNVVVSIQPIHSIVSQIMGEVGQPDLLLPPNSSPHHFQLRPTDAQRIHEADLIIWVGPELETFLEKPLKALNPNAKTLTLTQVDAIHLLPYAHHEQNDKPGAHDKGHEHPDHHHEHDHGHHHHEHGEFDPHIWLSPEYALLIVNAVEEILSATYPEHKQTFANNAQQTIKEIQSLEAGLGLALSKVKEAPFLVYHDGYQYFTKAYGLNARGYITDNPHVPLSLNKIRTIKAQILEENIHCLFGEPETNLKVLEQIAKDTPATVSVLDPIGAYLEPGPQAYGQMMAQLADAFESCLKSKVQEESNKP